MSVRTEISRITTNVKESYSAIKETGMEVTGTENSDALPTSIRNAFSDVNALLDNLNGVVI